MQALRREFCRGYLEGGFKDLAMQELKEMAKNGLKMDAVAVQALLSDQQLSLKALELLKDMDLAMDAAAGVMTCCLKHEELQVASGSLAPLFYPNT